MIPSYALQFDSSGRVAGVHQWADSSAMSLAPNEIECSFEQFQTSNLYKVQNGTIAPILENYRASQSALIASSAQAAQEAPLSFTNAAGISGLYSMDSHSWTKYLAEWTEYVGLKEPLPNNNGTTATFYTAMGAPVEFTLADIVNFYKLGKAQVKAALAKQATLLAQIQAATTTAAVRSIVW